MTCPEIFSTPKLQMCWKRKFASLCLHLFHCVATWDCHGMQPVCISDLLLNSSVFLQVPHLLHFCGVLDISNGFVLLSKICLFFFLFPSSWYYFYSWVQPHWRTAGYWWQGGSGCYIPKGTWGMWATNVVLNLLKPGFIFNTLIGSN